ncbi:aldo/keto reductase [Cellulophaga sp. BC115SP]|uniref:aldo/keto reductase n=1 Tax=Cellulophaga sp. BC115SP TaxID=2683263 RepID=UPI0014126AE3|nr:aldo/keto reductase [Cellulophaga sp. BC115SP]NBB29159.1 aldo/keto reductase [Cellulophaga sp. BC115SP]
MQLRKFQTELISEIGLGTWQLGSADWGNVTEESAFEILNRFVDLGGNFIDTADVYGGGISEKVIGKFLKTRSETLYVATKLGRRGDNGNGWPQNFTYEAIRRHVEESLQNLQLEQLYLEQLHCIPTEELQKGDVFDSLRKLQDEGLIKYWGVSVETAEEALICLEQEGLASLQIIFNLFRQHLADEIFAKAQEKGVSLIVRVPLASGLLSGKYTKDTTFATTDHRNYNANGEFFNVGETFSGVAFEQGVEFAQSLGNLMPDERLAQWSLRWILDHPAVTTVIPGATKISQVAPNVSSSDLQPLSAEIHTALREVYDTQIKPTIRGKY